MDSAFIILCIYWHEIAGRILNIQKVIITKRKKGKSEKESTVTVDYWMNTAANQANVIGGLIRYYWNYLHIPSLYLMFLYMVL